MDAFLMKNQGITREFDWISGESGKINIFLEKYFSVVNFSLFGFIFSDADFHALKHFPTLSYYEYYVPRFLCLKIHECSSATCLIVVDSS